MTSGCMKNKNVKRRWNDAAESWADFVREGKDYDRLYMNNPAMFKVLGNVSGKKVLDLGCGEGFNTRLLAKKGAKVTGIDFSEQMIALATEAERSEKLGIAYKVMDAARLSAFGSASFDLATAFMSLQDIEDDQGAVREVARVMKRGGRFVLAIPHPCFEKRFYLGGTIGCWEYENPERKEGALFFKVDRYFERGSEVIPWRMKRLTRHFRTITYHRTLADYADALHDAGLVITRLVEPLPLKEAVKKLPEFFRGNDRIPHSIVFEARKG